MNTTTRKIRFRALAGFGVVAIVAAGLSTVAFNAHAAELDADGTLNHVTLGDSYSSGHGASYNYVNAACKVSAAAYSKSFFDKYRAVVQPSVGANSRNLACTGAKVAQVAKDQVPLVARNTDVVTLTVGGNDLHFASAATTCTVQSSADCNIALTEVTGRMESVRAPIGALLDQIRTQAPNALIALVGYPIIFDQGACGALAISEDNRGRLRSLQGSFNDLLKQVVGTRLLTVYVDSDQFFTEHRICDSDRWINQVTDSIPLLDVAASYHPNAKGQAAIGQAIFDTITGGNAF